MVYMSQEAQGKMRKLSLPYHGPFSILEVLSNCLLLTPVDRPNDQPILVSRDRVTSCPNELPDVPWLGPHLKRRDVRSEERDQQHQSNLVATQNIPTTFDPRLENVYYLVSEDVHTIGTGEM